MYYYVIERGYDLFHFMWKYLSAVYAVFFLICTILALRIPLPKGSLSFDHVNVGMFLLALGIYAIWQISYGPYVADYSRYLPEDTPHSQTFWYTYCGSVIASIWMMILGAFLTVVILKFAA
ncbi:cytosine permease [Bacillus sp. UNC41MFS5]|uniref:cytosine permease n=1 Tax=Bacillus sp. UNC41MFS5 TaxID=1449046 RepID=UPI0022AE6B77|nr:cytosine permease [Bacillus sp. UNC41MFS5]